MKKLVLILMITCVCLSIPNNDKAFASWDSSKDNLPHTTPWTYAGKTYTNVTMYNYSPGSVILAIYCQDNISCGADYNYGCLAVRSTGYCAAFQSSNNGLTWGNPNFTFTYARANQTPTSNLNDFIRGNRNVLANYNENWHGAWGFNTVIAGSTVLVPGTNFGATMYSLDVSIDPASSGTVTSSPTGLTCSGDSCQGSFVHDSNVSLQAVPGAGYVFYHWTDGTNLYFDNPHTFVMSGAKNVQAVFSSSYLPGCSVNAHWNIWAGDFSQYTEKIKRFSFVRDGAWWSDLETSDFVSENDWSGASWSYPYYQNRLKCVTGDTTYQSGYDELVKKFQAADAPQLLLVFHNLNESLSHNSSSDVTYAQYYDYVKHVVERYDGDGNQDMPNLVRPVRYFEIGNEVDCKERTTKAGYLPTSLAVEDYVNNMLKPAYLAAKQANPNAVVMNAGLSMNCANDRGGSGFDIPYLSSMFEAIANAGGASNNFFMDVLALHYYHDVQNPEGLIANIQSVRTAMATYGIGNKPIWITEFGVSTLDGDWNVGETGQASILTRYVVLMKALGISNPFIFLLKDNVDINEGPTSGLHGISCNGTTENLVEKQAMPALRTLAQKIGNLSYQSMDSNQGVYRITFGNGTRTVQVVWYTASDGSGFYQNVDHSSEQTSYTVNLNGHTGMLSDMGGNAISSSLSDQSSITIGENPQYIEY